MATWSYDFGALSADELAALKPTEFTSGVEKARDAAVTLIESGAVGEADTYRVVIRADGGAPSGLLLEVRPHIVPEALRVVSPPSAQPVITPVDEPVADEEA